MTRKTKKAMKRTNRILSIASLFFAGILAVGCVNRLDEPLEPQDGNAVTLTTTISLDGTSATRALTSAGVKSFAPGEQIAVIYTNTADETVKAVSEPFAAEDISSDGKKARVTVTLNEPKAGSSVRYIYPAAMAKATIAADATIDDEGTVDFTRLDDQDGTLESLAASLDLAVFDGNLTDEAQLPASNPLTNRLAIAAFTLKDSDDNDFTSVTTQLVIKDGTHTYTVKRITSPEPVYVALQPTVGASFTFTAIKGGNFYVKTTEKKTLEGGCLYPISVTLSKVDYSAAKLGDLFYSDGSFSTTIIEEKTPIGVIAYLGTDNFTETGTMIGGSAFEGHGLVLCLRDISHVAWRRSGMTVVRDLSGTLVDDTGDLNRNYDVSGYTNTKALATKANAANDYPAFYRVWNYTTLPAPATTTGWFMPSIQQWVKMLTSLGGLSVDNVVWRSWKDLELDSIHNIEAAMSFAGDLAYDSMSGSNRYYWSSSEATAGASADIVLYPNKDGGNYGSMFTAANKVNYWTYYVRPVLAF